MNRRTLPLLAAVTTTATILTTGCGDLKTLGNPYNHTDEEIAAAAALLPTLPTLEDTEKHLTETVVQIADADVVLTSDDGIRIFFGSDVNAVISAQTGCRLPAERTDPTR